MLVVYINKAFQVALFLSFFNFLCALANFHRCIDDGKLRMIYKQAWVRLFITIKSTDAPNSTDEERKIALE